MTTPAILNAKNRMEAWARWLRRQAQESSQPNLLGKLLGESMEGYRRGGIKQLSSEKAFACLIRGSGYKPDSQEDDDQEWEVQHALDSMPKYLREQKWVLYVEFLFGGTQETKLRTSKFWMGQDCPFEEAPAQRTYKGLLQQGLIWMDGRLNNT